MRGDPLVALRSKHMEKSTHDSRRSMFDDFGIGATEVIVFLTMAVIGWGLCVLAALTKRHP